MLFHIHSSLCLLTSWRYALILHRQPIRMPCTVIYFSIHCTIHSHNTFLHWTLQTNHNLLRCTAFEVSSFPLLLQLILLCNLTPYKHSRFCWHHKRLQLIFNHSSCHQILITFPATTTTVDTISSTMMEYGLKFPNWKPPTPTSAMPHNCRTALLTS